MNDRRVMHPARKSPFQQIMIHNAFVLKEGYSRDMRYESKAGWKNFVPVVCESMAG
jgi:hypothetical protein